MFNLKYNNQDKPVEIEGYTCSTALISIMGQNLEENTSGFKIFNMQGEVLENCSEYKYRWDVLEDNPNKIFYTNIESYIQAELLPNDNSAVVEPLNNEALTECVADLMYELSLVQLGMMGGE